jgi:hypothetical protein
MEHATPGLVSLLEFDLPQRTGLRIGSVAVVSGGSMAYRT